MKQTILAWTLMILIISVDLQLTEEAPILKVEGFRALFRHKRHKNEFSRGNSDGKTSNQKHEKMDSFCCGNGGL
ncbi:hypothetical protein SNE40_000443 [Patella caerulea]|uniref:Uncharacterized protein n=1 Tax=Patella caerulea TaxID=87958 RepID=A0AAN8K561_PATCE